MEVNLPTKKSSVVCILGMHRSGTSLITRVLNICGLPLGEKDDVAHESYTANEKGQWEHLEILEINKDILSLFHGTWDKPPIFPHNWENDIRLNGLYKKAHRLVEYMNSKHTIWGFKEPRTCLTLPFWQKVIPDMKYIIPVRFPKDVADSLYKRDGIRIQEGILLWLTYWRSIINLTKDKERLFVYFDNFFNDREQELRKVINFINHDTISVSNDTHRLIQEFITDDLYHNKNNRTPLPEMNMNALVNLTVDSFLLGDIEHDLAHKELEEIKKSIRWKFISALREIVVGMIFVIKFPIHTVVRKFRDLRLFLIDLNVKKPRKGAVLVTSARNEGVYLLEWICYHRLLGFDHIVIFSNDNDDGSEELLERLSQAKIITYHNTTGSIPANTPVQAHVFSQAFVSKEVRQHEWMCVIDLDEFIFLKKHENIQGFLKDYPHVDGIAMNWAIFGTGGAHRRTQELTLDRFRHLSLTRINFSEKSIARIDALDNWSNPHRPVYKKYRNTTIISPDGKPFIEANQDNLSYEEVTQIAVINHYMFRSFEEFLIKRYRGGGTKTLGKDIQVPPLFRTFRFYNKHNSRLGIHDDGITHTSAYIKLKDEMTRITKELDLQPILDRIEAKTQEVSDRAWTLAKTDPLWSDAWDENKK